MKKITITFFQVLIVLIGIAALAFMLYEPHLEGRNINATLFEIYFKDPFLAVAYAVSIAFFVGLYQVFKLLGSLGENRILSTNSLKALRTIKYCALVILTFALIAEAYLFAVMRGKDDIAGGVAMGLFIGLASVAVASVSAVFERRLQNALNVKI